MIKEEFFSIGHALGIDVCNAKHSASKKNKYLPDDFYRNHYCYSNKSINEPVPDEFKQMKNEGLIETSFAVGTSYWFVTDKGKVEFREKFYEYVTSKYVAPSKAKQNYQDFIDSDYGWTFSEWLNIIPPKSTFNGREWMVESVKYSGVKGVWCKTKKEAKVSYKEELKKYKKG